MDVQSKKIVAAAREILKAHGYFVDNLWHSSDIYFLCDQMGYPRPHEEEIMTIFDIANEQFDGEYGLSWPQLERALKTYMQRREILHGMCEPRELRTF